MVGVLGRVLWGRVEAVLDREGLSQGQPKREMCEACSQAREAVGGRMARDNWEVERLRLGDVSGREEESGTTSSRLSGLNDWEAGTARG